MTASATVAGLAAYFRGLDSTLTTAASVKQRIVALAYARPRRPGRTAAEYSPNTFIWNGQQNGGSIVGACSGGSAPHKKRQNGGSCPIQAPPQVPTFTFRTGGAQPTCVSGAACGTSCKGFFCQGNPLPQNPDFLDPRNPDSVQNPTGPYAGDWDGTISRATAPPTGTTALPGTTTAKPAPTGAVPPPGHGETAPSWKMIYYELRDSAGETQNFYGYDDGASTYCTPEPSTWKKVGGQIAQVPASLTGITVYGDGSCHFSSSDMSLRCNNWAPASCVDRTSGINYGGGGTCRVDASAGVYQYYQVILTCSW